MHLLAARVFDTVTNIGGDIASTSIKFSYGNIIEDSQFSGYDGKLVGDMHTFYNDSSQASGEWDFKEAAKKFAKDQIANQVNGAMSAIESAASGFLQKLTMGNVYGLRNKVFSAINNPQAITNAAIGGAAQLAEEDDITLSAAVGKLGGNIYSGATTAQGSGSDGSLEKVTIFGDVVQPDISLPTERIHPPAYTPGNNDGISPPVLMEMIMYLVNENRSKRISK